MLSLQIIFIWCYNSNQSCLQYEKTSTLDEYIIKYISDYVEAFLWKTTCIACHSQCVFPELLCSFVKYTQLNCSVVSNSLRPHGLQHARDYAP